MMRLAMSTAAAGLLRSLFRRAGVERDRILLTEYRSTDWQSLTFIGEQHRMRLRIPAPDAGAIRSDLVNGLDDADLVIPGHILADITVVEECEPREDGSIELAIEALTVED